MARAQQPSSVGSFPERPVTVETRGAGLGNARRADFLSRPQGDQRPDPVSWLQGLGGSTASALADSWDTYLPIGMSGGQQAMEHAAKVAGGADDLAFISHLSQGADAAKILSNLGDMATAATAMMDISDAYLHHDGDSAVDDVVIQLAGLAGGLAGDHLGVAAGGQMGAMLGTMVCPGIGTAVGGALGATIGGYYGGNIGEFGAEAMTSWAIHSLWGGDEVQTVDDMPAPAKDLPRPPMCTFP